LKAPLVRQRHTRNQAGPLSPLVLNSNPQVIGLEFRVDTNCSLVACLLIVEHYITQIVHCLTQCSHDLSLEVEPGHHCLLWRTYLLSIHEKKGVISIFFCAK
jgi:hypothetical protein